MPKQGTLEQKASEYKTAVKICGLRSVRDLELCLDLRVEAVGLNFWRTSPRYCEPDVAKKIVEVAGSATRVVAVVVDMDDGELRALQSQTGVTWVQFHGREAPERVEQYLPHAYKALGVQVGKAESGEKDARRAAVLAEVRRFPGEEILLDAHVRASPTSATSGGLIMPGGTGKTFDWELATEVAKERQLTLAGGLHPDNVAQAIQAVHPAAVDVASGVESKPGVKDAGKVKAFVEAVRC